MAQTGTRIGRLEALSCTGVATPRWRRSAAAVEAVVGDVVGRRLPRMFGVADAEGEVGEPQFAGGAVVDGFEDHPPVSARTWQVGLDAVGKPRAVAMLRVTAPKVVEASAVAFQSPTGDPGNLASSG